MRILETTITDMHYDADFDRIEAAVALIIKPRDGQPARQMRLRTSQPRAGEIPIEERLAADAQRLALRMSSRRPAPGHTA